MPLTYDFTRIKDFETLHADEGERVITEALMFASLPLGFGEITAKNAGTVYAAVTMFARVTGDEFVCNADGTPYAITPQDVQRRIGLRTNAFNSKTPQANVVRVTKDVFKELTHQYEQATESSD